MIDTSLTMDELIFGFHSDLIHDASLDRGRANSHGGRANPNFFRSASQLL
jgi:hypothetical protein